MNDELEPLSPELARLLEAERGDDVVPAKAAAEVLAGVRAKTEGGGASTSPKAAPVPVGKGRLMQVGAIAFVGGALVGAWLQAQRAPASPPPASPPTALDPAPTQVEAPPAVSAAALPTPPAADTPRDQMGTARRASAAPPRAANDANTNAPSDVAAERRLIEEAQTALARGDGAAALAATSQHESRYAHGALAEEREYVAILALDQLGRTDEAARRAALFLRAFPSSVFAPRVAALFDGAL